MLEILNHYVQLTVLKVNQEKKKIRILRNWAQPVGDFNILNVLKGVGLLLKKIRKPDKYKFIISLDSRFATTIYASIPLVRPHPKEMIDEADIDNLISQAVWRFFDRHRPRIAQKMNIDEMDVLLGDIRIRGIKLDSHKIVNPIGFKAKSVEIFFSQTFLVRDLMKELREFLPRQNIAFITEAGTAMCHVLSRAFEEKYFMIGNLFPNQTALFSASETRLAHHDDFDWGENDLHNLLMQNFCVSRDIARHIFRIFVDNNASQNFMKKFENILNKEFQAFINGLELLVDENVSKIYLNPFFAMPQIVFSDRFHNKFQKPIRLMPLSTDCITEKLGYEVQCKSSTEVKNIFSVIAAFLEINFLPQNDKMSHLANRRVRWLIT